MQRKNTIIIKKSYLELTTKVPPEELAAASNCKPCAPCAARLFLEGRLEAPPGEAAEAPAAAPPAPEAKRQKSEKSAAHLVAEFAEIRECVEKGILTTEQAQEMCTRLMTRE